jgi:PTH1 family peptidyl-tRNA hydrolase
MKAIVGLGNPGPRYRHTRHNVGWWVVDRLAARWRAGKPEVRRQAEAVRCVVDGEPVLLLKPTTGMNESGRVARALVEKDGLPLPDLLVVYDDLDLELGRIRVRAQGSSGGHNGIRSIQQHLSQLQRKVQAGRDGAQPRWLGALVGAVAPRGDPREPRGGVAVAGEAARAADVGPPSFPRIKVGIGRPQAGVDPIEYVLSGFTPDERVQLEPALERAADAVECWLRDGIGVAMNRFNGASAPAASVASPPGAARAAGAASSAGGS